MFLIIGSLSFKHRKFNTARLELILIRKFMKELYFENNVVKFKRFEDFASEHKDHFEKLDFNKGFPIIKFGW